MFPHRLVNILLLVFECERWVEGQIKTNISGTTIPPSPSTYGVIKNQIEGTNMYSKTVGIQNEIFKYTITNCTML